MEGMELLRNKMLLKKRKDFGNYLAEILNITPPGASKRFSGETKFSLDDVKKISVELNLTLDDVDKIFIGRCE